MMAIINKTNKYLFKSRKNYKPTLMWDTNVFDCTNTNLTNIYTGHMFVTTELQTKRTFTQDTQIVQIKQTFTQDTYFVTTEISNQTHIFIDIQSSTTELQTKQTFIQHTWTCLQPNHRHL